MAKKESQVKNKSSVKTGIQLAWFSGKSFQKYMRAGFVLPIVMCFGVVPNGVERFLIADMSEVSVRGWSRCFAVHGDMK